MENKRRFEKKTTLDEFLKNLDSLLKQLKFTIMKSNETVFEVEVCLKTFSGIYKTMPRNKIFTTNPFTILLYNQIQIYFHIWLKISVKTKILLLGNAPPSLVNLYAQVTKKRPLFYRYKSIGLAYLIYMVDHGKIIILLVFMKISS